MFEPVYGGCACGAVRYRLASEPYDCGWCHCRTCQLTSGGPALVFATVPADEFYLEAGDKQARWFSSSDFGRRLFCSECGSQLAMKVTHQPDTIDFTVATLDDPDHIAPSFHIFHASRVSWFDPGDTLPRHDRFRPETRGLDREKPA